MVDRKLPKYMKPKRLRGGFREEAGRVRGEARGGEIRTYPQSVSTTTTHPNGDPASSGTAYGDELLLFHGRDAYDVVSKLRAAAGVLSPHTHARPEEIEADVFVLIRRVRLRG